MENLLEKNKKKAEISYPTLWSYRIIGLDETKIKDCIMSILKDKEHKLTHSNSSKNGKYKSFVLETKVDCEKERIDIFNNIKNHKDIKMVL